MHRGSVAAMTFVLYGARGSGSSIIEAACAELGISVQLHDLDARGGEHRGDAYAQLNPVRKMPTLVIDDAEVLTETVAILVTLDERHRDAGLLPAPGTAARAQALRWLMVLATDLYPLMEIVDHPERFAPDGTDPAALGERGKALWLERWASIEAAIAGDPWFLPSGFSAVDLYVTVLSRWDMTAHWRSERLPRVDRLAARVRARPRVADALGRHFGPLAAT